MYYRQMVNSWLKENMFNLVRSEDQIMNEINALNAHDFAPDTFTLNFAFLDPTTDQIYFKVQIHASGDYQQGYRSVYFEMKIELHGKGFVANDAFFLNDYHVQQFEFLDPE